MTYSKIFSLLGLFSEIIAVLVFISPYLNPGKNIDDYLIIKGDKETGKYTQKKHIKELKVNKIGVIFLLTGFVLQIGGVLLS